MDMDGTPDKPRLTSEQKKRNHIESEKKRREAIRAGFERLSKIVPECEGHARSESHVLQKTVQHLKEQLEKKDALRERAKELNMSEGEFEKIYNDIEKTIKVARDREEGYAPKDEDGDEEESSEESSEGDEGYAKPGPSSSRRSK